ncbi:MAG: universal stress protein [Paracoccaceae bacterium]|jgi:nucleotide-binding universal stress UspA family protein
MYKTILVPIDLDVEQSWLLTFDLAAGFADNWKAEIHVMTVVPSYGLSIVGSYFPKSFEAEVLEKASAQLREIVNRDCPGADAVTAHVAHGNIYEEILSKADDIDADLIIMTSHRPELKDYLLGPNAARVMRHAKQSVFVVRA